MRVKLSEKYKDERETICNKILEILDLDENNSFLPWAVRSSTVIQQGDHACQHHGDSPTENASLYHAVE
jgi:hypothetical protein